MMRMLGTLAYFTFVLLTFALVWAVGKLHEKPAKQSAKTPHHRNL